ncbi:MAG TPA: hypothetical protein VMP01_29885 [Pirellulaceae bacterium]|nr:hypothetical protein [Pirellulaceae bacterium]
MSIDSLAQRFRYQRSGKVRWGRLLVLLPIPLLVAVAMGATLCWTLAAGLYYAIFTPLIVSLPLLAAAHWTVRWSHCRNVVVAALLGGLLGIVMYLGYFHAHLVSIAGPGVMHRVDELPRFIQWRMHRDVNVDERLPQPQKPDVTGNWLRFGCELLAIIAAVAGISFNAASGAYCEGCGQWMRMGLQLAPAGSARKVAEYLAAGRLGELPPIPNCGVTTGKSAKIKVESCRRAGQAESCCSYLTLEENDPGSLFGRANMEKILTRGQISQEELGWLARSVPALAPLAPPGFAAAVNTTAGQSPQIAVPAQIVGGAEAVIETLPPEAGQRVFTKTNAAIAICLSLLPLVTLLCGIGLLVAGWWFWPANLADTTRVMVALTSLVTGGLAALFGLVVTYVNVDYFNMQYCLAIARNEIALRAGAIVDPRDPEAFFVDVVPRERWTDIAIEKATDGGFVLVDHSRRQVLFEGIKQRYRIPAAAILHSEAECIQPQAGGFAFYATVVQALLADAAPGGGGNAPGVWETPFMVRPTTFTRFSGAYRRRSCEELAEQIRRMTG